MGLPAEQLDNSVEQVIESIDTRPFRRGFILHSSDITTAHITDALDFASNMADEFWGIKRENETGLIPQTLAHKIGLLKDTVRIIPALEEFSPRAHDWVTDTETTDVDKLQSRKVGVEISYDLQKLFKKTPQTALEVYRTPSIREIVHGALTQIGDPVTAVIDRYEHYLDEYEQINLGESDKELEHSKAIGRAALEHMAFAAGGQPFVELLGSANLEFHRSEISRRNLS